MGQRPILATFAAAACALAAGCGSAPNPGTDEVYPTATGILVDAPVANLEYRTATRHGFTGPDGAFAYLPGESVVFRIGSIALPEAQGRDVLTPIDLFGSAEDRTANQVNRPAFNLAILLVSLDEDGDPANGIHVSDATREALITSGVDSLAFDVTAEAFRVAIAGLVAGSTPIGTVATVTAVEQHLATSLGATPADSDGDGLFDYEDELPFDAGGGAGGDPPCAVDTDGLKSLGEATATIRFGLATWAGLGLTLNSFIGVEGIGLTVGPTSDAVDLLDVPSPVGFSADDPQAHPLNPAGVAYADPSRRTARATDFRYDATDPATFIATATGQMGFAGVSRWTVSPDRGGGQLLFGDYNLFYNGATSTWELVNRIDFPLTTFTLGNAQVTTAPGHRFTITGDLIGAVALGILLGDALGVDFGDIRIEGRCVPEATDPS